MDMVRMGFIGAGRFANEVHYPSFAEFEDVTIAGICDRDEARLNTTADAYGAKARFAEYEVMLDQAQPDAVCICMPPHHLFDVAAGCLKRGLHVFMEKPPGVSAEQTRALARIAESSGSLSMVGFNRRFMPALVEARRIVEQRGPIRYVAATYYKHYLVDLPYFDGPATMLVLDGIHAVDTLRWLGGDVVEVAAAIDHWRSGYPNAFRALMRFDRGATGSLSADWAAGKRVQTVEMHAEGVSVVVDIDRAMVVRADDAEEEASSDVRDVAGSDDFRVYYGFRNEDRHFIDCVKRGELPETNLADAARTMELAELIERGTL